MTKYLAGVLSVIAVGVLLIAYGLLVPRATVFDPRAELDGVVRPSSFASEQVRLGGGPQALPFDYTNRSAVPVPAATAYAASAYAPSAPVYASSYTPAAAPQLVNSVQPLQHLSTVSAPLRRSPASFERSSGRDWTKTAMIIGGSSAAGAGLGAIFGGKKGALIGAAIGGGASALYETTKR